MYQTFWLIKRYEPARFLVMLQIYWSAFAVKVRKYGHCITEMMVQNQFISS